MADSSSFTDFGTLDTYVPTFDLKPFRAGHPERQDVICSSANPLDSNAFSSVEEYPATLEWYIRPAQNLTRRLDYDELVDKLVINHGWKIQDFDILKDRAELLMKDNRQVFENHQGTYNTSDKPEVPLFSTKDSKPLGRSTILKTKEAIQDNHLEVGNDLPPGFNDYLLKAQAVHKSNLYNQNSVWRDGVVFDRKKQVVSEGVRENLRVQRIEKNLKEKINVKSFKVHQVNQQRNCTFSSNVVAKKEEAFNIKTSQNISHPTSVNRIENIQGNSVSDINIHYNNCKSINTRKLKFVSPQPLETEFSNPPEKLKHFKEMEFNDKTFMKNVASQNGYPIQKTRKTALNDTNLNSYKSITLKETSLDRHERHSSAFVQHLQKNVNDSSEVSDTKQNASNTIKMYSVDRQSFKSKISDVRGTKEHGLEVHDSNFFSDTDVVKNKPSRIKEYITSSNLQGRNKKDKTINKANHKSQPLPKSLNKNSLSYIQVMEIMKILRSPKLLTSNNIPNSHNAVSYFQNENYSINQVKDYRPIVTVKTTKNDETLKLQNMFFNYLTKAFHELVDNVKKRDDTDPGVIFGDTSQHILEMSEVQADSEENNTINESFVKDQIETDFESSNNYAESTEPITVDDSLDSTYEELSDKIATGLNISNIETSEEHLIDSLSLDYNVSVDDVQDKRLERWALKYNLYPEITKYLKSMEPVKSNDFQEDNNSQRTLNFSGISQVRNTNFSKNKTQNKLPVKHRVGYVSRKGYFLKNSYSRRLKLNQRLKRVRDIYLRIFKNNTDI